MMQGDIGNTGHAGEANERNLLPIQECPPQTTKQQPVKCTLGLAVLLFHKYKQCSFVCAQHAHPHVGWECIFSHVHDGLRKCNQQRRGQLTSFSKMSASTRYLQTHKINRMQSVGPRIHPGSLHVQVSLSGAK